MQFSLPFLNRVLIYSQQSSEHPPFLHVIWRQRDYNLSLTSFQLAPPASPEAVWKLEDNPDYRSSLHFEQNWDESLNNIKIIMGLNTQFIIENASQEIPRLGKKYIREEIPCM